MPTFEAEKEILNEPHFQATMMVRSAELRLMTTIVSRITCSALTPAIRMMPAANQAKIFLKNLAHCYRKAAGPHLKHKIRRLLKQSQDALESGLADYTEKSLADHSKSFTSGLKFASELPLEWIRFDGVPLMFIYECSRIPLIPASLSYQIAMNQRPTVITSISLKKILVLRSFLDADPIKSVLKTAIDFQINQQIAEKWDIEIEFMDVTNAQEIIDALNNYSGSVIVFDCHGALDDEGSTASLVIAGQPIRLWEYRNQITRMPPIVMLSACDTLPIDEAHTSVALSMFKLGAKTVLATLLPINAIDSSVFLARLLHRIGEFVPLALKFREKLTWRELVSGLLKMSHATEIYRSLEFSGKITKEEFFELHSKTNSDINYLCSDWMHRAADRLATLKKIPKPSAMALLTSEIDLTWAMMQVQLGNPEQIFIIDRKI